MKPQNKSFRMREFAKKLTSDAGFTMIPAMTAVLVGTLLSLGAWTAANADISLQNTDRYTKVAYTQAESAISDYVQHMAEDPGFWQFCDEPPGLTGNGLGQTALNDTDRSGSTGTAPRRWLPQPSVNSTADAAITAQYTIDLIPTNGKASCKGSTNRNDSMVDKNTGVIRMRMTGRAGPPAPASITNVNAWRASKWKKRSIVLEFRRKGFLDYAYFTDKEGRDPVLYSTGVAERTKCTGYYVPEDDSLAAKLLSRYYYDGSGTSPNQRANCTEIRFANADNIRGPFHTNDSVFIEAAGGPNFGETATDVMEVYDDKCPFRLSAHSIPTGINDAGHSTGNCPPASGTGSIQPDHTGPIIIGAAAGYLPLPESNADLKIYGDPTNSDAEYRGETFYGTTRLVLGTNTVTVTNAGYNGGLPATIGYPASGVIYVDNEAGVTSCEYDPNATYPAIAAGCALAEVSGNYNTSLTIASAADIVVTGNIQQASTATTAVLGLVADNFVRVRHYRTGTTNTTCSSGAVLNTSGTAITEIRAAVLALRHSFTVDNYGCGSYLGTLHVWGVLAQAYRGAVAQGSSGYTKNYEYDRRMKYLTPPHFLSPTLSTWRISRYREQTPSCLCT